MRTIHDIESDFYSLKSETDSTKKLEKLNKLREELADIMFADFMERNNLKEAQRLICQSDTCKK